MIIFFFKPTVHPLRARIRFETATEKIAPIKRFDKKRPSSANMCRACTGRASFSRHTERFGFFFFAFRANWAFRAESCFFPQPVTIYLGNAFARRSAAASINQNVFLARWIMIYTGASATSVLIVESANFLIRLHVYQPNSCSLSDWNRSATAFRPCTTRSVVRARCSAAGRPGRPPTLARSRTPGRVRTDNETRSYSPTERRTRFRVVDGRKRTGLPPQKGIVSEESVCLRPIWIGVEG